MTKEELKKVVGKAVIEATVEAKQNPSSLPITTSAILLSYLYKALDD